MLKNTTMISISERTNTGPTSKPYNIRMNKIVIHDGWSWEMGCIQNEKELKKMLDFLGIEMAKHSERDDEDFGKIAFYELSKPIINDRSGGFWTLEELKEKSKTGNLNNLKKIKGLSNGSLVDCYVEVLDDVVYIYRPNPNAKEVYVKLDFDVQIKYMRNNWYL